MSSEIAIRARGLSKCYPIFDRPQDRLKQMFVRGRRKYYRDFWAVRDIDLDVYRGETVGIVGKNGSGKSTLLQVICGTLTPTSGELTVNGRVTGLLELGAGFNAEFTGRENVYMNGAVLGLSRGEIDNRFDSIAAFADIGAFIDQPVKTYSSGMYVRLAFAVVAHVQADILIVDEALAVGDYLFQQKCMRFLRSFMKTGTVFFASHDIAAVKNLCNRALWLENGSPRMLGEAKEVCESYLAAYVESLQGATEIGEKGALKPVPHRLQAVVDQRLKYINNSQYRNDIEVFAFDQHANSFGKGGASIVSVQLLDDHDHRLSWIVGGEIVVLSIQAQTIRNIDRPILGFYLKDKLGQYLFGDNTYLTYRQSAIPAQAGSLLEARFRFQMPLLPTGKYSICAAIAEGTQEDHVQHHWIHDALFFESHISPLRAAGVGLVGIPMLDINLAVNREADLLDTDLSTTVEDAMRG